MKSNNNINSVQSLKDHPLGQALLNLTAPFRQAFYQAYQEQGKPFGDTEQGFTQWLHSISEMIPDYRK